MKKSLSTSIIAALALLVSSGLFAQSANIQASFFSKEVVSSILSQEGCTGLRMYPVIASSGTVVMIIGINASGDEIYKGSSYVGKYYVFSGIINGNVNDVALTKEQAQAFCSAYSSKNSGFVSDFTSGSINSLLGGESAGISIKFSTSQTNNFLASAYKKENGAKTYGRSSPGEPCPSACGEPGQYLCFPK